MLGLRLTRLIEKHSEELALGLANKLRQGERTTDFRRIESEELQGAAAEIYRNVGEWLLQKTEDDIQERFREIGARRAAEGIGLHQFVWALVTSRNHLWEFLQRESCVDNVVELFGELELHQMLNQFYDRAIYYGIMGYGEAKGRQGNKKKILSEVRPGGTNWPYHFA